MRPFIFAAGILTSAQAVLPASVGVTQRSPTVCNGHAELCNRSYSNITFAGSHDSFAFSTDPLALARTQEVDIPTQLSLGIRLLQAQSHMCVTHIGCGSTINFIFATPFLFDGGTVAAYLKNVVTFLNDNPNDVLTLLFTNPEELSFANTWAPVFEAANVTQWAYKPPQNPMPIGAWPTLGEMITNNKRLVIFIDYVGNDTTTVDYIIPEFDSVWETPYDATNTSFPCSIDRIRGTLPPSNQMYLINHNLDFSRLLIPDVFDASVTNSVSSIVANANECAPVGNGRYANFVLLDWVNIGQALTAVNRLNGLA